MPRGLGDTLFTQPLINDLLLYGTFNHRVNTVSGGQRFITLFDLRQGFCTAKVGSYLLTTLLVIKTEQINPK